MKRSFFLILILPLICLAQPQKSITLEDIWLKPKFYGDGFWGLNSMKDGVHYTEVDFADQSAMKLKKYKIATGKEAGVLAEQKDLVDPVTKKNIPIYTYSFSPDETKLLLSADEEAIYRHSTKANFFVYDIKTKKLTSLSGKGKQRLASFSPDGSKVAFVRDNNLYYVDLIAGKEVQVTFDGEFNKIINGATDWVYEEEFAFDKAYEWNSDGSMIAFYKTDETEVREFNMTKYGKLYPSDYRFKYPKAGEKNAVVSIYIYDVGSGVSKVVPVGEEKDQYIPRIHWTAKPESLVVYRMNRLQNKLELMLADASAKTQPIQSRVFLTETSKTYIEITDNVKFLGDGMRFIWTSEQDGFNHIYLYDLSGKMIKQITGGNWDVTSLFGVDEKKGLVYYGSAESSPMERDVYSIAFDGSAKKKLNYSKGTSNFFASENFNFYVITHSDANTPQKAVLYDKNGKQLRVLVDNKELNQTLSEFRLSKKEFFKFKTSEGVELNGWMIKPQNFDPAKKYPVFMTVYGGPGSNTVNDSWGGVDFMWHQLLAEKGYIVVSVDNRGTGCRGRDFRTCTYLQLGKYETIDQTEGAKYLGSLSFVDKSRIGIFGWSYGGYMSSLCITLGADYFKAAIAVAPVTTWRYYDSIYTERYNGLPQDNPSGYDDNSPINHVGKMRGKYLLVHGTADDNVHFQNSVEMTNALIQSGKQFECMYYPDKNHSIGGGKARMHLYTMMTDFLLRNL